MTTCSQQLENLILIKNLNFLLMKQFLRDSILSEMIVDTLNMKISVTIERERLDEQEWSESLKKISMLEV